MVFPFVLSCESFPSFVVRAACLLHAALVRRASHLTRPPLSLAQGKENLLLPVITMHILTHGSEAYCVILVARPSKLGNL